MSDIFLSYKSEDKPRAQIIAEVLELKGYSVWWDRIIPPGRRFSEVIQEELDAAKCVVVLWSKESVKSEWVETETSEGKRRGILIPVMIEDVNPPLAFRMIEAAKLIDWEGTLPNPEIDLLLKSIGEKVGRPPVTKMEEEQQLNIVKEKEKALKEEEERKTREKQVEKEHDSELREKETEEAQFLAQKEAGRLEQERREQEARQNELSALYSKGKEALAAQDWQTAIKLFKDILAIDATYKDGSARLKQAEQQLNIDKEKEKALKEEDERKSREKQLENERRDIEAREKAAKEAQLKAQEMANRVTILELEQERLQRQREEERTQREEKGLITKEKQELKSGERKQGTHYKNILVALIVIGIVGIILWATIIIMPLSLR
jgi:hypothetical protein